MSFTVILIALACVWLPVDVEAYCYSAMLDKEMNAPCQTPFGSIEEDGEEKFLDVCESCSCHIWGYSCCGIGYNAGSMVYAGCVMKKLSNCCYQFVSESDETESCTDVICPT